MAPVAEVAVSEDFQGVAVRLAEAGQAGAGKIFASYLIYLEVISLFYYYFTQFERYFSRRRFI